MMEQADVMEKAGVTGQQHAAGRPAGIQLCWKAMRLLDIRIPAGCVQHGQMQRLVMPRRYQLDWVCQMTGESDCMWLDTGLQKLTGSSEAFARRVACVMQQRGALANLSLRENIMLPFLYAGREDEIRRCSEALPGIASRLDIAGKLDEQAGERSGYMHGLIALGRTMLMRPDFIVVQDVHAGMPPHRQERFRELFCEMLDDLGAGVLYLSASGQDGSGLEFCSSLDFAGAEEGL